MINQSEFNKRQLSAIIMLAVIGGAAINILPFIFSSFSRVFNAEMASTLSTIELLGICIAGLSFNYWRNLLSLWLACVFGVVLYIASNGLTYLLGDDLNSLMLMRLVSGIGAGVVTSHAFSIIGRQENPEPLFALVLVVQVIWSAAGSFIMPVLDESGRLLPFTFLFVCGIVALFPVLMWLPKEDKADQQGIADYPSVGKLKQLKWLMSALTVFWYWGLGMFWADSADRGVEMGISGTTIGVIFASGYLASMLGNGIAIGLSRKFNRAGPMLIAGLVHLLVYFLFYLSTAPEDASIYIAAVLLYSVSWAIFTPFQLGLYSEFSVDGRFTATFLPATVVGMTLGTQTNAVLGEEGKIIMVAILLAICIGSYYYVFRSLPKLHADLERAYKS